MILQSIHLNVRVIIPEVVLIQLSSWGWAHSCSKHVEYSNKHIIEETVRQVGYLPELYKDARSEKYLKKKRIKKCSCMFQQLLLRYLTITRRTQPCWTNKEESKAAGLPFSRSALLFFHHSHTVCAGDEKYLSRNFHAFHLTNTECSRIYFSPYLSYTHGF